MSNRRLSCRSRRCISSCAPYFGLLERLPEPQAAALRGAFALSDNDAPDLYRVPLAVLTLLAEAAEERPLLCLIDDAHWMDRDSEQALAFAARRLQADGVAMLFTARVGSVRAWRAAAATRRAPVRLRGRGAAHGPGWDNRCPGGCPRGCLGHRWQRPCGRRTRLAADAWAARGPRPASPSTADVRRRRAALRRSGPRPSRTDAVVAPGRRRRRHRPPGCDRRRGEAARSGHRRA